MASATETLPVETGGTDITRFNALRHGVLSRYTVLPWESADEYRTVVEALVAEHHPQGPTEEHLVEEIAGILWRKRRLRLAEAAAHRRRNDAYEAALAALRDDKQAWWADTLACDPDELGEREEPATADVEGLRRFLEGEVLPWFENRQKELANRPLIREQAFGEALDPDKLERLGRYEVHLDRKLKRMLTMLLRLKDLRRTTVEG